MKKVGLVILFVFFLVSSAVADVTSLYVVRGGSNNLYKMTCVGTSCSGWSQINGQFAQQPTLFWNEDIQKYVLIGVSVSNVIWRSTFNRDGSFNNDWTKLSGSSPSPVAAAGGGVMNNFRGWNGSNAQVYFDSYETETIKSFTVYAPADGYFLVRSTGELKDAPGARNCVQLSTSTSFSYSSDNSCSQNPSAAVSMMDMFAIEHWFSVSAGNHTYYALVNNQSGHDNNYAWNTTLSATYFPYSY